MTQEQCSRRFCYVLGRWADRNTVVGLGSGLRSPPGSAPMPHSVHKSPSQRHRFQPQRIRGFSQVDSSQTDMKWVEDFQGWNQTGECSTRGFGGQPACRSHWAVKSMLKKTSTKYMDGCYMQFEVLHEIIRKLETQRLLSGIDDPSRFPPKPATSDLEDPSPGIPTRSNDREHLPRSKHALFYWIID